MEKEIWTNIYINNEKTIYDISTFGQIKNTKTNKILKPYSNHKGYLMVRLYHNKEPYDFSVHRLVALHFMPVRFIETDQVNHEDGNKKNNHLDNLTWVTGTSNIKHAVEHNLITYHKGKDHHMVKYDEELIHKICKMISKGFNNNDIIDNLNVKRTLVQDIRDKRSWTVISDQYSFPKLSRSKYDDQLIYKICELLEKGYSTRQIRHELNLPAETKYKDLINKIRNHKYYNHISKNYVW